MRRLSFGATMGGMQEKARWTIGITPFAIGLGFTLVVLALVQFTDVPARPWAYIAVVVGILTAVSGLLLAMIRAREVSD